MPSNKTVASGHGRATREATGATSPPWLLAVVFVLLTTVFAVSGYLYFDSYRRHATDEALKDLTTIASFKVEQVASWRRERLADASALHLARYAARGVRQLLEGDQDAVEAIRHWVSTIAADREYHDVYLFAPDHGIFLAARTASGTGGPTVRKLAAQALADGKVAMSDFHRHPDGSIVIEVVAPLTDPATGERFAVMMLEIDPAVELYPLILLQASRSPSAETLLVRHEGGEVIFLNELRHHKGAPLSLRLPVTTPNLPAALASSGNIRTAAGTDYRGVLVMAVTRDVPGTDWHLVSKIDADEVLGPIRVRGRAVAAFLGLLVALTAVALLLVWRQQRAIFYREQLRAERDRQALVSHFEHVTRFGNDIILLIRGDGRIVDANDRAVDAYGYALDELRTMTIASLRAPETRSATDRILSDALDQGSLLVETTHQRRNGTTFPVEASIRRIEAGGETFLQSIVRDISERKQAEARLKKSEEVYRLLTENANDVIYLYQLVPTRGFEYVSPSVKHLTGFTPEEYYANPRLGLRLSHANDRGKLKALLAGEGGYSVDLRWLTRDGRTIWIELRNTLIRDKSGTPVAIQGIARDVTARKDAEVALAQIRDTLQAIVDTAPVAIMTLSRDLRVTSWNHAAETIFGWSAGEVLGQPPPFMAVDPKGNPARIFTTGAENEARLGQELECRRKDGTPVVFTLSTALEREVDGQLAGITAVAMDMTAHRRTEELFRHSQKLEAVGQLAGGIAHDFNNLLQAMVSVTEILRSDSSDPEKREAKLSELSEHLRRAAQLTRQLLIFSRLDSTKFESLDLNDVVSNSAALVRRLGRENIRFDVLLHPGRLAIRGDRGQLEQVFMNLAINAFDAMPDGGHLTVSTTVGPGGGGILTVRDSGCGIPADVRTHIFEPFFTTKPVGQGTGLGLSVVHGIVTRHHGSIVVDSTEGEGTTVRIEFPVLGSGENPAVDPALEPEAPTAPHRAARILVIEDETAAREALHEILGMLGHDVVSVGDGAAAEALAGGPAFDLILTDFLLPDTAGTDLAKRLRRTWPDVRVILMSGYTSDKVVRSGIEDGAIRFLQKPFDTATLERELAATLAEVPG